MTKEMNKTNSKDKIRNDKYSNILIEQNNTTAITCNYIKDTKYGDLNTSYFNFQNSIVSVDIDGKYYNLTSGYRKRFSNIFKLSFGNKESLKLNILDEIDEDTAYNDAFEIANILVKYSDFQDEYSSIVRKEGTPSFFFNYIHSDEGFPS